MQNTAITRLLVSLIQEHRSLTLKLRKRKPDKKVEWTCDTVDNEHLGRRSSKCCCIYEKQRAFGESSTESEDEDDEGCSSSNCIRGHKKGGGHGPRETTHRARIKRAACSTETAAGETPCILY
uniref:E3 ubiquitin-protein ligase PPP1R11 n=1 Tax=Leptobrachium leishanense TaxID=445787 RepID=A0A8C5PQ06_9ANUR